MTWTGFELIIVMLMLSLLLVSIFHHFKLPSILAYLIVGVFVGPSGVNLISTPDDIYLIAELGVVFLLFTIGLEISFSKLWEIRHTVLVLGSLQVLLCTSIPTIIAYYAGMSIIGAFVASSALSLSSTAIVTKQLKEQGELSQPQGKLSFGLLIFQDIAAIPFLIIIPLLASAHTNDLGGILLFGLIKGISLVVILWILLKFLFKPVLLFVTKQSSQELFILVVLFIVTSAAWLTHYFGLSMAFGAFVAGAILSETEFRNQLEVDILPFRDMLLGLFFITIGIRLKSEIVIQHWYWVIWLTAAIILFKSILIAGITKFFGKVNKDTAIQAGLILAHGGEFGFALLALAMNGGIIDVDYGQVVLSGIIMSMILSTLFIKYHKPIAKKLKNRGTVARIKF